MDAKQIWKIIKHRYRLPTKAQMSFEMGFPEFLIGKCRASAGGDDEIKTKKITLAMKGIVLSDTLPLSWFTSSIFIPWAKAGEVSVSEDYQRCTIHLNDPGAFRLDLPWSKAFDDYTKNNR